MITQLLLALVALPAFVPTFGFDAVQCQNVREVVCLISEHMDHKMCENLVHTGVQVVNLAIGKPVMHYKGEASYAEGKQLMEAGVYVVGMSAFMAEDQHALGITQYQVKNGPKLPCITQVGTMLNVELITSKKYSAYVFIATTVHEMIHALGANHAGGQIGLPSIMAPSLEHPGFSVEVTKNDMYTLRLVYNNGGQ